MGAEVIPKLNYKEFRRLSDDGKRIPRSPETKPLSPIYSPAGNYFSSSSSIFIGAFNRADIQS